MQAGEEDTTGGTATLEEGLALFEKKKYYEASKLFSQATLDETPEAAAFKQKAEFFLGKSLYSMGYLSASLAYFQRIAPSGPEHSYYRATLTYLAALAKRLTPHAGPAGVTHTRFMARATLVAERADDGGPVHLGVFPDGRAVIRGVRNPERARAIYDRYVGG